MQVAYKTKKLEKQSETLKSLTKALGLECAKKFARRISEFAAAECLEDLRNLPGPRIHELTGDRKGEFSADLKHPLRLISTPSNEPEPRKEDGGWEWSGITLIEIQEIADTHD